MANNCIMPCSLVLIKCECFYCHATGDDLTTHQSSFNFGIIACPEHKLLAIRDIKAYLHVNKIAFVRDLMEYDEMKAFVEAIGENVRVLRSSGDVDNGWLIEQMMCGDIPCIREIKGESAITMAKNPEAFTQSLSKNVPLNAFLDPKLEYCKIDKFPEIIEKLVNILEKGIYIDSYTAQDGVKPSEYVDTSHCIFDITVDGKKGRVFVPELVEIPRA
jgi:hypothetical protein